MFLLQINRSLFLEKKAALIQLLEEKGDELKTKHQRILQLKSSPQVEEPVLPGKNENAEVSGTLNFDGVRNTFSISNYLDPYNNKSKTELMATVSAVYMNVKIALNKTFPTTMANEAKDRLLTDGLLQFFCLSLGCKLYPEKFPKVFEATQDDSIILFVEYVRFFRKIGIPKDDDIPELKAWMVVLSGFLNEKNRLSGIVKEETEECDSPPISEEELKLMHDRLENSPTSLRNKEHMVIHLKYSFKEHFKDVNIFNYLDPKKFPEEAKSNKKTFFIDCSFFFHAFPKASTISYDGVQMLLEKGVTSLFAFLLAVRSDPENFPESSDLPTQVFLCMVKKYCAFFHHIGLPTDEELALLSEWFLFFSVLPGEKDRRLHSHLKLYLETMITWYSFAYRKRESSVKLHVYVANMIEFRGKIANYLKLYLEIKNITPDFYNLLRRTSFKAEAETE